MASEMSDKLYEVLLEKGFPEELCREIAYQYMKTDYTKLTADDFQRTLNNYLSYLVKEGNVYENNGGM